MYKKTITRLMAISILLWIGNSFAADSEESAFTDLQRGTMLIPCMQVELSDGESIFIDLRLNQRGSAFNWEVVAYNTSTCEEDDFVKPVDTEEKLGGKPEDDVVCIENNNANNCGTKEKESEDEETSENESGTDEEEEVEDENEEEEETETEIDSVDGDSGDDEAGPDNS